jgi:hypothetical protein
MSGSRRLRTVAAAVGLLLLLGGVPGGPGQPRAHAAAPRFYSSTVATTATASA